MLPTHNHPLHYLGNRFLTLPDKSGRMYPDDTWLNELFTLIVHNHPTQYKRCIEPFSGSASWSLAAMEVGFAEEYIINDSNKALVNMLMLIQSDPTALKTTYHDLVEEHTRAPSKKDYYLSVLGQYNEASEEEKALILPFIVNHSWGGFLFHDEHQHIIYCEDTLDQPRYLANATLSIDEFDKEIDRASILMNTNHVVFHHGDFLNVVDQIGENDFIALNPPYPENERSLQDKTGMYTELYEPGILHTHLEALIQKMEAHQVHYFMTYGFYNPNLSQFVLSNANEPKNYFRALGSERCAFGMGLDQMYFPKTFSIPMNLETTFLPASKILCGEMLTTDEAVVRYQTQAGSPDLHT